MARVAIVILNFNGRPFLEKFLPTIIKLSPKCDIVVADNHSADNSLEYLYKNHPGIRILEFNQNYGYSGGYNRALDHLDSDFFIILNSDVEVTLNWIEPIISLFERDEKIAAIQPKLLDYKQKDKFEYAGGAGGYIDKLGYPFCRGRIFNSIETDTGQYDDTNEIFWATGACFFIRAKLFKQYGGFDESFFAHMEEIDLCWRMKRDGYKVFCCGESVVYHVGGGTLTYGNPIKTYLNFRNSLMVLIKNLPVSELAWKLPARWLIDYVAVINFLLRGHFKDGLMIIKAHLYVTGSFISTFKKRSKSKKGISNNAGRYPKLLLFDYHISGVRNFSDLEF
jgi:GT2 family glycosyltransferase